MAPSTVSRVTGAAAAAALDVQTASVSSTDTINPPRMRTSARQAAAVSASRHAMITLINISDMHYPRRDRRRAAFAHSVRRRLFLVATDQNAADYAKFFSMSAWNTFGSTGFA